MKRHHALESEWLKIKERISLLVRDWPLDGNSSRISIQGCDPRHKAKVESIQTDLRYFFLLLSKAAPPLLQNGAHGIRFHYDSISKRINHPALSDDLGLNGRMDNVLEIVRSIDAIQNSEPNKRKSKRKKLPLTPRQEILKQLIGTGRKGENYAKVADILGLSVRVSWTDEGCPNTYTKAYKEPYWRKKISEEKANFVRRHIKK